MRRNLQPLSDYLDQWFLTWVRWASLRGSSDVRQWSVRSDQKYFSIVAQLNFVKFECVCVCVCDESFYGSSPSTRLRTTDLGL